MAHIKIMFIKQYHILPEQYTYCNYFKAFYKILTFHLNNNFFKFENDSNETLSTTLEWLTVPIVWLLTPAWSQSLSVLKEPTANSSPLGVQANEVIG